MPPRPTPAWRESAERHGLVLLDVDVVSESGSLPARTVSAISPAAHGRPSLVLPAMLLTVKHLLTYLLTYLLTCLLAYLLTYLLTYFMTYALTHLLTYLLSRAFRRAQAAALHEALTVWLAGYAAP